jgi:hypothetical protein
VRRRGRCRRCAEVAARAALGLLLSAASAPAQTLEIPVRRVEVTIGGVWLGTETLGSRDAELRQNTTPPQPRPLFSTTTELTGGPAFQVGAGYAFSRRWLVEGGAAISRPEVRTSIRADAEGAPAVAVAERVDQYVVEGRLVVVLHELRLGARTMPFVAAGLGYVRQLHEGLTLVEEGHVYHVGGGVRHWLLARRSGLLRGAGVRADARLSIFVAGISFDDDPRPRGAISGAAFFTF